jgi:hypothetical protein
VARPYSDKFLRFIHDTESKSVGIELAKLCIAANIPAAHVASALEASRMTVYGWFRGRDIRAKKRIVIEVFMDMVRQDIQTGILPAKDVNASKAYISSLLGVSV